MDFVPLLAFASAAYDASHLRAHTLLCSLADNRLKPEGCKVVAAVLDKTQITSLKCATPPTVPGSCMDFVHVLAFASAYDTVSGLPWKTGQRHALR